MVKQQGSSGHTRPFRRCPVAVPLPGRPSRGSTSGGPTTTSLSGCPRQTDVQPLTRPLARHPLVDAEHDDSALETLAAEHVPVEDTVLVPEGAPVAVLPLRLLQRHLLLVPRARRQQCDVLGPPALLQQRVDLVVGDVEGVLGRRLDEGHLGPVATAGVHPHRRQRRECRQDLARVAQGCLPTYHCQRAATSGLIRAGPLRCDSNSAAAAGASAAFADVAGTSRAHLRPAGHAHRRVRSLGVAEHREQVGRGVDLRGDLTGRGRTRTGRDRRGVERLARLPRAGAAGPRPPKPAHRHPTSSTRRRCPG